jgi:hypothetical protein
MAETLTNASRRIDDLNTSGNPSEGKLTTAIENQTSKVPSITFLNLAIGSMVLSAGLALLNEEKSRANFVGMWAPTFLLLGIYNKLVKLEGNDRFRKAA